MQVILTFSGLRRNVMHSLFINYHSLIAIKIHFYGQYHFCFAEMILLKADTLGYYESLITLLFQMHTIFHIFVHYNVHIIMKP